MLEGGMSLLEGGLLLLEPVLHLLTCAILLAELLLHHSERNGLLCQVSPQLLSLFGLLLGLDLPGPCPLEGGEVLLKLGLHRGEGRLLLRRCGLRLSQGGARLLQVAVRCNQCPIPLQQRGLHPVNRRGTLCDLSMLV
jgi:hypothetical protein